MLWRCTALGTLSAQAARPIPAVPTAGVPTTELLLCEGCMPQTDYTPLGVFFGPQGLLVDRGGVGLRHALRSDAGKDAAAVGACGSEPENPSAVANLVAPHDAGEHLLAISLGIVDATGGDLGVATIAVGAIYRRPRASADRLVALCRADER